MAGKDRKRQIARERYERRLVQRAQARAKARRRTAMGLAAGAVIVIVGTVLLFNLNSNGKNTASAASGVKSASASPAASSSAVPPIPTTAAGCTSKLSSVASPVANFPILPAGVDAQLKTEPIVTVPAGAVPTTTKVKDIVVGTGATVGLHDSVTINYLGLNYVNCEEFDSSWARDAAATFSLDGVVPGFTKGIGGNAATGIVPMKVGGRREIIVTPADGYGTTGQGTITGNEELIFVVDVLAASPPAATGSPSASPSVTPSTTPAAGSSSSPSASTSGSPSAAPSS